MQPGLPDFRPVPPVSCCLHARSVRNKHCSHVHELLQASRSPTTQLAGAQSNLPCTAWAQQCQQSLARTRGGLLRRRRVTSPAAAGRVAKTLPDAAVLRRRVFAVDRLTRRGHVMDPCPVAAAAGSMGVKILFQGPTPAGHNVATAGHLLLRWNS